jgi:hypothetical protein
VACSASGAADRVIDLRTGREQPLSEVAGSWSKAVRDPITPAERGLGRVAYGGRDFVAVFDEGSPTQFRYEARPAPWYAPAVGEWIVWTEIRDGDLDLHALPPGASEPVVLAAGPGPQHHPVSVGGRIAWVDRGDVVVAEPASGTLRRYEADAGFESAPALVGDRVCWEDRASGDILVRCDDGWSVEGRMPSASGGLLLVHTRLAPVLYGLTPTDLPAGLP